MSRILYFNDNNKLTSLYTHCVYILAELTNQNDDFSPDHFAIIVENKNTNIHIYLRTRNGFRIVSVIRSVQHSSKQTLLSLFAILLQLFDIHFSLNCHLSQLFVVFPGLEMSSSIFSCGQFAFSYTTIFVFILFLLLLKQTQASFVG